MFNKGQLIDEQIRILRDVRKKTLIYHLTKWARLILTA
jgi:hypothetical protein